MGRRSLRCDGRSGRSLVAKDGQRQQQPKQQGHDDQRENIGFHGVRAAMRERLARQRDPCA
jgi:hypothetical protein